MCGTNIVLFNFTWNSDSFLVCTSSHSMKVKFMALHFHYNRGQGNARPSPRLWSEEEDYDDDGDQKLDWKNENIHFWYLVSIVAGLSTHSLGFLLSSFWEYKKQLCIWWQICSKIWKITCMCSSIFWFINNETHTIIRKFIPYENFDWRGALLDILMIFLCYEEIWKISSSGCILKQMYKSSNCGRDRET